MAESPARRRAYGIIIRRMREDLGWSRAKLADKVEVSDDHVKFIESGKRGAGGDVAERLAEALYTRSWVIEMEVDAYLNGNPEARLLSRILRKAQELLAPEVRLLDQQFKAAGDRIAGLMAAARHPETLGEFLRSEWRALATDTHAWEHAMTQVIRTRGGVAIRALAAEYLKTPFEGEQALICDFVERAVAEDARLARSILQAVESRRVLAGERYEELYDQLAEAIQRGLGGEPGLVPI